MTITTNTTPTTTDEKAAADLLGRHAYVPDSEAWTTVLTVNLDHDHVGTPTRVYTRSDVVLLPRPGERVNITTAGGDTVAGWWTRTDVPGIHSGTADVSLLGLDGKSTVFASAPVRNLDVATARPRDIDEDLDAAGAMRLLSRNAAALSTLIADADEFADRNDLCGVYDEFMEDHGFPGREREYDLYVTATVSLTISQTARSLDAAKEAIDSYRIWEVMNRDNIDEGSIEAEQD